MSDMKLNVIFPILYFVIATVIFAYTFDFSLSKIIGSIFVVIGFLLWITAHIQLGESFALLPKAKKLVTNGIYSKIRHPIYLGGTLVLLGTTIYFKSTILLIFSVSITLLDIYRARREEGVLERKFGKSYRKYKSKTWF